MYLNELPASQLVSRVGKYLYKHIDGAYKFKISPNMVDIYTTVLYQIPQKALRPGDPDSLSEVQEMNIDINLTTYQNKLRMNLIELSPDERTLGFYVIVPEKIEDEDFAKDWIMSNVRKTLNKLFDGYIFIW